MKNKFLIILIFVFALILINRVEAVPSCNSQTGVCTIFSNDVVNCNNDIKSYFSNSPSVIENLVIQGTLNTPNAATCIINVNSDVTITSTGKINGNVDITSKNLLLDGIIDASGKGYVHGIVNNQVNRCCASPYSCSGGPYTNNGGRGCGLSNCNAPSSGHFYQKFNSPYPRYGSGGGDLFSTFTCSSSSLKGIGGNGGGSVSVNSNAITINGQIFANGEDAQNSDMPGGGASGGQIILASKTSIDLGAAARLEAKGGKGYYYNHPPSTMRCGGGGSGGLISLQYLSADLNQIQSSLDISGGSNSGYPASCEAGGQGIFQFQDLGTKLQLTSNKNSITTLYSSQKKTLNLNIANIGTTNDAKNVIITTPYSCDGVNNNGYLTIVPSVSTFPIINPSTSVNSNIDITASSNANQIIGKTCNVKIDVNADNTITETESFNIQILPKIDFKILDKNNAEISSLQANILLNAVSPLPDINIKNDGDVLKFKIEEFNSNSFQYLDLSALSNGIIIGTQPQKLNIKSNVINFKTSFITNLKITPCTLDLSTCYINNAKILTLLIDVIELDIIIDPSKNSPLTFDPKTDKEITITTQASLNGLPKSILLKDITIGGEKCLSLKHPIGQDSTLICGAPLPPKLADGKSYNLDVSVEYNELGNSLIIAKQEQDAINYKDITPPTITITPPTYDNQQIIITTKDNVGVSNNKITGSITSPSNIKTDLTINPVSSGYLTDGTLEQVWDSSFSINPNDKNKKHTITIIAEDDAGNSAVQSIYPTFAAPIVFNGTLKNVDDLSKGKTASFDLYSLISEGNYLFSSNSNGDYSKIIDQGNYQVKIKNSPNPGENSDNVVYDNVDLEQDTTDAITTFGDSPAILQALPIDPVRTKTLAIISNYDDLYSKTINFNYRNLLQELKIDINNLEIVQCPGWDFQTKTCNPLDNQEPWITYDLSNGMVLNETTYTASLNLAQGQKIGALALTELCSGCTLFQQDQQENKTQEKNITNDLKDIALFETDEFRIEISLKNVELYPGENREYNIKFKNKIDRDLTFNINQEGSISKLVSFEKDSVVISGFGEEILKISVKVPKDAAIKTYIGNVVVDVPEVNKRAIFPVSINVKELKEEDQLLNVNVKFITITQDGKILLLTQLNNVGNKGKTEVTIDYSVKDAEGNLVAQDSDIAEFYLIGSLQKTIKPKQDLKQGKYIVEALIAYDVDKISSAVETFEIRKNFIENIFNYLKTKKLLEVSLLNYLLFVMFGVLVYFSYKYYQKYLEKKRREMLKYQIDIDLNSLPKPGLRSSLLGKIAEMNNKAYINLDALKLHTIVAGSTGSGKTVAAQVMSEGALMAGVDIIVFDPSAQWSGFLKKCEDKYMLQSYPIYDMKQDSPRKFLGRIKVVEDPLEIIDVKELLKQKTASTNKEGSITVYCLNKLEPKDIDIFVANTVREIFEIHPEESEKLKLILVYDEVHRLLEKFGGGGKGFVQIERGLREFRKWGIGLVLISQVLSDFVGEIKANISTEIQMRTRYEGDLSRLREKYGEKISQYLIRSPVGTGMMVNAEYNKGRPYFFTTRPLLHNTKRLDDTELELYNSYDKRYEDLKYKIDIFKKNSINVSGLDLELKKVLPNLLDADFNTLEIKLQRIDLLLQQIIKLHPDINLEKIKVVNAQDLEKSINEANQDRNKYIIVETPYDQALKLYEEIKKKMGETKGTLALKDELNKLELQIKDLRSSWSDKKAQLINQRIIYVMGIIKRFL